MAKEPIYVKEGDRKVPFLRGVVTHSLVQNGLSFKQAYEVANLVRERVRTAGTVSKKTLRRCIHDVLTEKYGSEFAEERSRSVRRLPLIFVRGDDSVPFSKGLLSQSLQASGLEPETSYAIALRIENSLIKDGTVEIESSQLRRLIYDTIVRDHGEDFAERYLLWRFLKNPDKPVVILFGGATGVGKTSVANEVARRLGIGKTLSTDTVREIMRFMFSPSLLPAIHSSSFEAWLQLPALKDDPGAVVTAFREQSIRVLVGIRAILARAVEENTTIVVEGVHLVPGLMDFKEVQKEAHIVPLVISTLNRAGHLKRFTSRNNDAKKRQAKRYRENFESIVKIQDYTLEMAEQYSVPIVENDSLDEAVATALSIISQQMRENLNVNREELQALAL